ncbi:hypothetical protein IW140_003699 [Coemansia sp. RSA 1813]|nr:hypothetical protein EV178_003664 [Coemansia sp. RSA 1646]KAJ1768583.1 hypothetical protein LPJ74_004741 [Coemansia sp. RSA 1843]KAJ2088703.1 hypothetical protein IW138_003975 [Coemansia sp. RSA 986]KAJ2213678.1 hypothetical protein EV179_003678 [Coemansia sp. RSA 487]KAJ2568605.1 hypothetical protein IW140_003699 [Coemansia sp. RSA 1813]
MGSVASSLSLASARNDDPCSSATRQLTAADKETLHKYLQEHRSQQLLYFETQFLVPYLNILPEPQALERLAILLYGDEYMQADAIFDLTRCGADNSPQTLRSFTEAVCKDAVARYWRLSDKEPAMDSWFVDWILTWPRKTILSIYSSNRTGSFQTEFFDEANSQMETELLQTWIKDANTPGAVPLTVWRKWWKASTAFQELMETMLQSTALFSKLLKQDQTGTSTVIRGVIESSLHSPLMTATDIQYFSGSDGESKDTQALLTPSLAWALVREMPSDSRHAWECIYSSKRDGRSWSSFRNAVERRGSVLLLVREKHPDNNNCFLFGAYIDAELVRKPTWHGSSDNMLFAIGPNEPVQLDVFRTTGFNNHYQYLNYATKTLPNGIGIGGQMGHFGLWIDSNFARGSSNTAATYESRLLSQGSEFDVDIVEAWLVRPAKHDDDFDDANDGQPKKSAMDANPEAVALLEMANKTMYSKMVREPDMDS